MATYGKSKTARITKNKKAISRRDLLRSGATLGAAGALLAGCGAPKTPPERLSEANLIGASELSGETLTPERIRNMRSTLEFTLPHLQVLREFDPGEEEPLTMFRV